MEEEILYEDDWILVCRKPAGLATQTARVGQEDLVSRLKKHLGTAGAPCLGVVHRLDQPVEGLLVFAKTRAAAAGLSRQLTEGCLNKRYLALVCMPVPGAGLRESGAEPGGPGVELGESGAQPAPSPEGRLTDFLVKEGNLARVVPAGTPGAKRAVLSYRLGERFWDGAAAVADISIETGRFHQIRVQMAHGGMPLVGDAKYGDERARSLGRRLMPGRLALCACELSFRHPAAGKKLTYRIEPDFLNLAQLHKKAETFPY